MSVAAATAPSSRLFTGLLLASLSSVAFSGKGIIVKLAYRHGVDAVTLIMYRMLFALPLFLALAWWAGHRRGAARAQPLRRRDWLGVVGLGVSGYYLASFLDFWGLQYITASLERLILYLSPTLVLVIGWLLFGRRISALQAMAMALSYAGVLLVFGVQAGSQGPRMALGVALVFGSAISYAVYLVYSGQLVQRLGSLRLAGLASTVACVLCIGQFALLRPLSAAAVAPEVIWLSLLNATLCTFAPVVMMMVAIERIGSGLAAQTGMIGPMATLALGVVVLDEPFTASILAGTALVLAGVFLVTRKGASGVSGQSGD